MSARMGRVVVMGVSGCGKSSLATALGEAMGLEVTDGDDLHSPASVEKMAKGIALSDADRWPWLDRVAACLQAESGSARGRNGRVVACSALKRDYRDRLRGQVLDLRFVFLDAQPELLRQRMAQRVGHFMQADLLESQLITLQRPLAEENDVLTVQAERPLSELVAQVRLAWAFPQTGSLVSHKP